MDQQLARDGRVGLAAHGQEGVFLRRQALDAGWSEAEIDHRVATGDWRRLQRGTFCHATLPLTPRVRLAAAVLAAGQSCDLAAAAHLSVIALHGLTPRHPRRPHVIVPHAHSPELRGVVVHRSRDVPTEDLRSWGDIPTTSLERALVDAAAHVGAAVLTVWLDEAIRIGRVTAVSVAQCALRLRRRGRRGPALVLELLAARPAGADTMDSCLEILFARAMGPAETAGWVHHYRIDVAGTARSWEVDFAFPAARVSVEVDGAQHDGFVQATRDTRRDADLEALGWRQMRFRWADVAGEPDRVVREVRSAVLGAPARQIPVLGAPGPSGWG